MSEKLSLDAEVNETMNSVTMVDNKKSNGALPGDMPGQPALAMLVEFEGKSRLTPRECEVLLLVANGSSNKETGRSLGISPRTVETHRAHIMEKLGARNAAHLVRIALGGEV